MGRADLAVLVAEPGQAGQLDDQRSVRVEEALLGVHGGGEVVDLVLQRLKDGVAVQLWAVHRARPGGSAAPATGAAAKASSVSTVDGRWMLVTAG